jgi:hypothetical protein
MKRISAPAQPNILRQAIATAVELVIEMDFGLPSGNVRVVPDTILWMLQKQSPELMARVGANSCTRTLLSWLAEYAFLRDEARRTLVARHSENEPGAGLNSEVPLGLEDFAVALSSISGPAITKEFRRHFASILWEVQDKEDALRTIEWGDADGSDMSRRACLEHDGAGLFPTSRFDHFAEHRHAQMLQDPFGDSREPLHLAKLWIAATLESMDDGRHVNFWSSVYTSVLGEWLQTTSPLIAEVIESNDLITDFYREAQTYVDKMRAVERRWHRLSYPLRGVIDQHAPSAQDATALIASMIDVGERGESARDEMATLTYRMFCRRLHPTRNTSKRELIGSGTDSKVIEFIRNNASSFENCYVIDSSSLPEPFAKRTSEQRCIAVRLPEIHLQLLDELARDDGLYSVFSKKDDGTACRLNLAVNHAFWMPEEQMWTRMFGFQQRIPVLYVFNDVCLFAQYQFNHYADLRRIADVPYRNRPEATLSDGDWGYAAKSFTSSLKDGTQVRPEILEKVVDLTGPTILPDWAAFAREKLGAT